MNNILNVFRFNFFAGFITLSKTRKLNILVIIVFLIPDVVASNSSSYSLDGLENTGNFRLLSEDILEYGSQEHSNVKDEEFDLHLVDCGIDRQRKDVKALVEACETDKWINLYNTNIVDITSLYLDSAFLLSSDGAVYQGIESIRKYYTGMSNNLKKIVDTELLYELHLNSSTIKYEIRSFTTSDSLTYIQLAIWDKRNGIFYKRFGAIEQKQNDLPNTSILNQLRADWAVGASSHDVQSFVQNYYTHDCVYFWHSGNSLHIGRNDLIGAYSYMEDPDYVITSLTPYHCEAVSPSLIFEIGRWDMPQWNGDYVIIWRKDSDGVWRILFDSNY